MRWFRFYAEVIDDPKVQRLDPQTFKHWVNILCLAAKNDGILPSQDDVAFALRIDDIGAASVLDRLVIAGLIDVVKGGANGSRIAPHGWELRQYKSDTSTERVKRFRNRSKAVSETAPDTDTDTEFPLDKSKGAGADSDKAFWDNAKAYLAPYVRGDPGRLIGKWVKESGQAETAKAITASQLARAVEPVPYIQQVLKKSKQGHDYEFTSPC